MHTVTEDKIASPRGMDTGSFFVDLPICTNCGRRIEKAGRRPAGAQKTSAWVHSHNRSIYCHGRGD